MGQYRWLELNNALENTLSARPMCGARGLEAERGHCEVILSGENYPFIAFFSWYCDETANGSSSMGVAVFFGTVVTRPSRPCLMLSA
jgi:hypothetical protein